MWCEQPKDWLPTFSTCGALGLPGIPPNTVTEVSNFQKLENIGEVN